MEEQFEVDPAYVEELFCNLFYDLQNRYNQNRSNDYKLYNQLNMARIIRQLLIDGSRVLIEANRYHKLDIRFIVREYGEPDDPLKEFPDIYSSSLPNLENYPPGTFPSPAKLEVYLKSIPMVLADKKFTVREIIKYVANDFGGVHLSPKLDDEGAQLAARFNSQFKVGNSGMVLSMVDDISGTTLRALQPLVTQIEEKYKKKQ